MSSFHNIWFREFAASNATIRAEEAMIHFRHKFHPAGHGTFFSGHVWQEPRRAESFAWVYDCGSKRPSRIRGLVEEFAKRKGKASRLDLLCISHFDSDHICGLSQLLKSTAVDVLALPYVTLRERLLLASEISEDEEPDAGEVVAMTLDPLGYLAFQGFSDRIGKVVFVHGDGPSGHPPESVPVPPPESPQLEGETDARFIWDTNCDPPGSSGFYNRAGLNVEWASHRSPLVAAGVYELVFYNPAPVEDRLLKSRQLRDLEAELAQATRDLDLLGGGPPKDGWVERLKNMYARNFGVRAAQKNEISLCVYGGPLVSGPFRDCKWFDNRDEIPSRPLSAASDRNSLLLTGDILLNRQRLQAIEGHLGAHRWRALRTMQIPHHGSRHNWELGTASLCSHEHSVFCAPGSHNHPDKLVKLDLATRSPVVVDYGEAVCHDFHA